MSRRFRWIAIGCLVLFVAASLSVSLQVRSPALLPPLAVPQPPPAPAEPRPPALGGAALDPQLSSLDAALDRLVKGNIAFNAPDHLRIGKPQIIEAKLAVNVPANVLITQLIEAGEKESASIAVADRMSAKLYGGAAFDVSPPDPQQQLISHQQVTSWTWEVTARQVGIQYLILSFDAILIVDGKEGTRNINTFKQKIMIEIGWPETPSEWFQWLKEWFENISWLWATVLVPLGLWAWNRFWKKSPGTGPASVKNETSSKL